MSAIISTYRHDYVPPKTNRYKFLKQINFSSDPCQEICPCVEEAPKPDLSALGEKCETTKWTATAPPGKLEQPRRVSEPPLINKDEKSSGCWLDQPNRFLKTITNTYPQLYERLKNMPQDELRRSIENSRFRSTYQVDYCHLEENASGLYDEKSDKNDEKQYRLAKLDDPCEEYQAKAARFGLSQDDSGGGRGGGSGGGRGGGNGGGSGGGNGGSSGGGYDKELDAEDINIYKPVKTNTLEDNSRPATSHWDSGAFPKQLNLTEYMDTTGRTGLIVLENHLHDHSQCRGGKNCLHTIKGNDPNGLKMMTHYMNMC